MRFTTPSPVRPSSLLQSVAHMVRPLRVKNLVLRVLRACWSHVAHLQLNGAYGPFVSGYRSTVCLFDGFGPMSRKNAGKSLLHSSQIVMPLPPYSGHAAWFGFVHLPMMARHATYSGVPLAKWVRLLHPQLVDFSRTKLLVETARSFPQSQRQSQWVSPFLVGLSEITVHLENLFPIRIGGYGKANLR